MALTYRPLAITGPESQTRIEFAYDGTLDDGITHNLGEFQFGNADEKYYQDQSISSDSYPFTILLRTREDEQTLRDLLKEKKTDTATFIVEHPNPTIGTFNAVVSQANFSQNSVSRQGVISVSVTFLKTITNLLGGDPSESINPSSANAMINSIDNLNLDQAEQFKDSVDLSTGAATSSLTQKTLQGITSISNNLSDIAKETEAVFVEFNNAILDITGNIDELVQSPFNLARQVQNLIQIPMIATSEATRRISAYALVINDILGFTETDRQEFQSGTGAGKNILSVAGLIALACVSATNYSAVSTESVTLDEIKSGEQTSQNGYLSRPQILDTASGIITIAKDTTLKLSEEASNFQGETFFTQYFDYSILNKNLIVATIKNLKSRILSATTEIRMDTEEELTAVHYSALFYQSVENATIEFFINSNKIHGDEIFLIPKGREIVYYV